MSDLQKSLRRYAVDLGRLLAEIWPDATSIVWKGSALKPWEGPYDFLPGLSDLDVHVYRPGGLDGAWEVRSRIFGELGPLPGDTPLQLVVHDPLDLPRDWVTPAGTYEVLGGADPPGPRHLEDAATIANGDLAGGYEGVGVIDSGVVERPDRDLWRYLLRHRWRFPPLLYQACIVTGASPNEVWPLNRTRLLALSDTEALQTVREATIDYYRAALGACSDHSAAPIAMRAGRDLLLVAADWASSR